MARGDRKWFFLIDANLPPRLCDVFHGRGYDATHVQALDMQRAPDMDIWRRGRIERAVIVTRDKDFASLAITQSEACPVVFVRLGNMRRVALLAKFDNVMQDLTQALDNGDKIIEIA